MIASDKDNSYKPITSDTTSRGSADIDFKCNISDQLISSIAAQQAGDNYLTLRQRRSISTEILNLDVPHHRNINMKKVNDIWLCRILLNARGIVFAQKAFGIPYTGVPRQLLLKGFR